MVERFDAVVIGAGPAGSVAALRLARLGWRTALVEKRPRHCGKACGHCLNPRALAVLDRFGLLDDVRRIAVGVTRRLRIHWPNRAPVDAPLNEGLLVDRSGFDQFLVDRAAQAGAVVFQPATARLTSTGSGDHATVDVSGAENIRLSCPLVVGADGLGSAVARAAGLADRAAAGRSYGFSFDIEPSTSRSIAHNCIEMFMHPVGGYLGVVRRQGDSLHVAAMVSARSRQDPRDFVRQVGGLHEPLAVHGFDHLSLETARHFAAVGPMPWRPHDVAAGGIVLLGDAAGYVEPFTGEGISWAVQSAEVLGDVVADLAPGAWNSHAARHYSERWRAYVASRQRLCRSLAFGLARPAVARTLLEAARCFPPLTRTLISRFVPA